MPKKKVIAIIDIGKTNKKLFLFDEAYQIVLERTSRFDEVTDEDGDPCESLEGLHTAVADNLQDVITQDAYDVVAINFSTYGASFVYLDEAGNPVAPLYNYLKAYPPGLLEQFYTTYGGKEKFSLETASPVLGNLNSGMQLYSIKYKKPALFDRIATALHLPQYISFLVSKKYATDKTSIGCHTNLWNFEKDNYHSWVAEEGLAEKFAPLVPSDKVVTCDVYGKQVKVGVGLHDSSAALIPYLVSFKDPFVLISTGTWCISMNPFNDSALTKEELEQDCLCYMAFTGKPVKASRLFAGNEHEEQVRRISAYFDIAEDFYKTVSYDKKTISSLRSTHSSETGKKPGVMDSSNFKHRDLSAFADHQSAYHQLIMDIIAQQEISTNLVMNEKVKQIFVDGGFGKNEIYMQLLAEKFSEIDVYAASVAQATALGTALALHNEWNTQPIPKDIIQLKKITCT